MEILATFWNFIWFFFWTFAFVAYLIVLFSILADIFRDRQLNGWAKAAWTLFLVFVPFITALIYLIARGRGMAERQVQSAQSAQQATEEYVRTVAGTSTSPADEIAKAQSLLANGSINADEFAALKAKALNYLN
ncbi:MAG: SHOCT domain-containing protein [Cryobacterium sp.]